MRTMISPVHNCGVSETRCLHDLLPGQCHLCSPRPRSVDLHPDPGSRSHGSGFGSEVTNFVFIRGLSYGLVPSGGEAYVFGSGHVLHHRLDCSDGADTPRERILRLPDPSNILWRVVADPQPGEGAILNIDGRPVTGCCGVCALRPHN
jgi:hypothetical protein